MENTSEHGYAGSTPAEKRRLLYLKQKSLLETLLNHHAITQAQYDKSLGDLTVKMGFGNESDYT